MKTRRILFHALMVIPLLLVLCILPIMPERVPGHYNINWEVDRWTTKYELLLMPLVVLGIGIFMKVMLKLSTKNNNTANEKPVITIGIATLLLFNGMTLMALYKGFFAAPSTPEPFSLNLTQFIFILLGIVYIIIGNILPKCKHGQSIGLRSKFSMYNDLVWYKCQRFGGILFIMVGIFNILGNIILMDNNIAAFILSMISVFIICVGSLLGSYLIYKKYKDIS